MREVVKEHNHFLSALIFSSCTGLSSSADEVSMKSRGNMPRRQPKTTPKALPRLFATRQLVISSCSEERSGGVAPSFSAQDSTYQALPMPIMSESVFPKAAAAMVEMP